MAFLLEAGRLIGFFVTASGAAALFASTEPLAVAFNDAEVEEGAVKGLGIGGSPPEAFRMLDPATALVLVLAAEDEAAGWARNTSEAFWKPGGAIGAGDEGPASAMVVRMMIGSIQESKVW